MDTFLIIRNEHKAQIAAFGKETRLAIDEAITAYNALMESAGKDAAAMARRQAVAVSMMAEDKDALEKAGFESFKDAALALVHLAPSNATQYRKAGDFIRSKDAPAIVNWYSPSALYEFTAKKIPVETINDAIKSGELKEDMSFASIRAWCEAHSPKSLTDGDEAEVIPMFSAHITWAGGETYAFDGTLDEIRAEMWRALNTDATMEEDRFGTFNPHATETRGKREVKGKGIVLVFGVKMVSAVYFPLQREKKGKTSTADTIAAQNETIEKLMAEIAALKAQK